VEGRVDVFAQEAGTVRRRLDCDVQGHSIFFLCLGERPSRKDCARMAVQQSRAA
jgi:hypothetical protein